MRILVTGATGFLGSHLVPLLRAEGHQVCALGRTRPPVAWGQGDNPVTFITADLKERALVQRALEGVEAIYHMTQTAPDR